MHVRIQSCDDPVRPEPSRKLSIPRVAAEVLRCRRGRADHPLLRREQEVDGEGSLFVTFCHMMLSHFAACRHILAGNGKTSRTPSRLRFSGRRSVHPSRRGASLTIPGKNRRGFPAVQGNNNNNDSNDKFREKSPRANDSGAFR